MNPLVTEIYHRHEDQYADVSRYYTNAAITKRITTIDAYINEIPLNKRQSNNARYKRLWIERRLLTTKQLIYTRRTPDMAFDRWTLELTDKRGNFSENAEERKKRKDEHILTLLNLIMKNCSDDQLRDILHGQ